MEMGTGEEMGENGEQVQGPGLGQSEGGNRGGQVAQGEGGGETKGQRMRRAKTQPGPGAQTPLDARSGALGIPHTIFQLVRLQGGKEMWGQRREGASGLLPSDSTFLLSWGPREGGGGC